MILAQRDKNIIWHPFTQEKTANDVIPIARGSGSYLYDYNNQAYLDLISSWWINLHGHAHPKIAQDIYEQALKLEQVIFAGFTHSPAVTLCESLKAMLPASLSRFFFSDNGSTAVEVALKMAYQFWYNQDQKERKMFLSFDGGYHGDTYGSMSVGFRSGFHDAHSALFFKALSIPYPETWDQDPDIAQKEATALNVLDQHLKENASQIAALILEPLIQGASGMRICRPEFIQQVVKKVRQYAILVIFDEVMTGFGRTGTNFALMQAQVVPDLLCLSKGLTGGFLPLALTVASNEIYQVFWSDQWEKAFAHGHSYTANPLACAAALSSVALLQTDSCQQAIQSINQAHAQGIAFLKESNDNVQHTRILGTISAFKVLNMPHSTKASSRFLDNGLLLRPLSQTVYLLPPYCITPSELENAYEKISHIIKDF